MLNLSDKELDRLSREAANQYDPGDPLGAGSWDRLATHLDKELGRVAPNPNPLRGIRRLPFQYAPVLILVVGVTAYFVRQAKLRKAEPPGSPPMTVAKSIQPDQTQPTISKTPDNRINSTSESEPQNSPASPNNAGSLIIDSANHSGSATYNIGTNAAGSNAVGTNAAGSNASAKSTTNANASTTKASTGNASTANTSTISTSTANAATNATAEKTASAKSGHKHPASLPTLITSIDSYAAGKGSHRHGRQTTTANQPLVDPATTPSATTGVDGNAVTSESDNKTAASGNKPAASGNKLAVSGNKSGASGNKPAVSDNKSAISGDKSAATSAAESAGNITAQPAATTATTHALTLRPVQSPHSLKSSVYISDKSLVNYKPTAGKNTPIKIKKPSNKAESPLFIGLKISPDFTSVNSLAGDKPGSTFGLTLDWQFVRHLYVSSGLLFSKKVYSARLQDCKMPPGYFGSVGLHDVDFTKGSLNMIEIPLNLRYDFSVSGNTKFFASAGFSSYILTGQRADYYYNLFGRETFRRFNYSNKKVYPFTAVNLSMGVEAGLTNNLALMLAPYIKVPTGNIGFGDIRVSSVGIDLGIKFAPNFGGGKRK